jgi:hypothetical protein
MGLSKGVHQNCRFRFLSEGFSLMSTAHLENNRSESENFVTD